MEDEGPPGVPEWVVTYGDMMSLLLTFFIMLVSLSEMKKDGEIKQMMDALQERFGPSAVGRGGAPGRSLQTNSILEEILSIGARGEMATRKGGKDSRGSSGDHETVDRLNHGEQRTIGGPVFFPRFSAELSDEALDHLDSILEVISTRTNKLIVRGHASPEPLAEDAPFKDQFELSYVRAQVVANYLMEKGQIDPRRIILNASGDSEPRQLTRDPQMQRLNRRVDVFLIDAYTTVIEAQ